MAGHGDCDCGDFQGSDSTVLADWFRWLDKRAEFRAAWLIASARGEAVDKTPAGRALAKSVRELEQLGREALEASDVIRTKDQLWLWATEKRGSTHALDRLPKADLELFISGVSFADYVKNGERHRHVDTFFYGDLMEKHGFSYEELFSVFALFGMGGDLAVRGSNKTAWEVHPRQTCQPRMYYSCSYRDC